MKKDKNTVTSDSLPLREEGLSPYYGAFTRRGRPRADDNEHWKRERNYTTTHVFDSEQYEAIRSIALTERVSVKQAVYALLYHGLRDYSNKKVNIRVR